MAKDQEAAMEALEWKLEDLDGRLERLGERLDTLRDALEALHGGEAHAAVCAGPGCRVCQMKLRLDSA